MAAKKSTRRRSAPATSSKSTSGDPERLAGAIEVQRQRLFQAAAILACLSTALADVSAPGHETDAPDLQYAANVIIGMLAETASALEPMALGLPDAPLTDMDDEEES